jgi:hypothetical protein
MSKKRKRLKIKGNGYKITFSTEFCKRKNPNWSSDAQTKVTVSVSTADDKWEQFKIMLKNE